MADFMKIDIQGDTELELAIKKAEEAFTPRVLMTAMKAGALLVENEAVARAPFKTGTLKRSIQQEPLHEQLAVKVGSNLPYAAMQEYGGVVVPVKAKFLHFFVDGEEVFTKGPVHIPAHPYLRPALAMKREEVNKIVREAILQQLRKAVK